MLQGHGGQDEGWPPRRTRRSRGRVAVATTLGRRRFRAASPSEYQKVKPALFAAASALALANLAAPAVAQHQHMPGMTMPMPAKPAAKKPAARKKAAAKKPAAEKAVAKTKPSAAKKASAAHSDHMPAAAEAPPMDHSQMDHGAMPMPMGEHAGHGAMPAALGPYSNTREASGTSWQPDTSEHMGLMNQTGGWMLMAHGVVNLVTDHQSGRRG